MPKEGSGNAVDAELEAGKAPHYAVEVLSSDGKKLTEYKLDANTGKVLKASSEPLEKLVTRVKPADIHNAQTTLSSAIHAAEQESGGKVIDAETEGNANTLHYELKVAMANGKTEKMKIDGATGKVAANNPAKSRKCSARGCRLAAARTRSRSRSARVSDSETDSARGSVPRVVCRLRFTAAWRERSQDTFSCAGASGGNTARRPLQ